MSAARGCGWHRTRQSLSVLGWLLLLSALGCGPPAGQMKVYPAKGKVLVDGQPLAGVLVVFYPEAPFADTKADYPRGATGEDGSFVISTYREGDGAPAGQYGVSVVVRGNVDEDGGLMAKRKPNPLGDRYKDPQKSGLAVSIAESANELTPFELVSKAPAK